MDSVIVSIICTTYNHEKYIKNCIDGFLMQENVSIEVLIHDDASTDNTAEIIREYESKYPEIIKPIYQSENQYSKGIRIASQFLIPNSKGKYLAFCEGDDYWTDPLKLKKQIDFLETHQDYVASVHNTIVVSVQNNKRKIMYSRIDRALDLEDVIYEGGQSFQTSSLCVRKEYLINKPDFVSIVERVGDYPFAIYLALNGPIYYFGEVMSVYRMGVIGSATVRIMQNTILQDIRTKQILTMLDMANVYSKYRYNSLFEMAKNAEEFRKQYKIGDFKSAYNNPYFGKMLFNKRIGFIIRWKFPLIISLIKKIELRFN